MGKLIRIIIIQLFLLTAITEDSHSASLSCGDKIKILDVFGGTYKGTLLPVKNDSISVAISEVYTKTLPREEIKSVYHYKRGGRNSILQGAVICMMLGIGISFLVEADREEENAWGFKEPAKVRPGVIIGAALGSGIFGGAVGSFFCGYNKVNKLSAFQDIDCEYKNSLEIGVIVSFGF